jgi:catechol 2,3-dioxygenase-like lactoylglutathione lyase family enzyme
MASATTSASLCRLTGVTFVAVYVDDFEAAYGFYNGLLGLEKSFDMGPCSCFLKLSNHVGLYLEGENSPSPEVTSKSVRASFGLTAESVAAVFAKVRDAGVRLVHQSGPQDMGGGQAWFQCYDPAGNIIEIVGAM